MLNIAIVEDNKNDLEKLITYLNKFSQEENVEINISHFSDGLQFLEKYKPIYDIVFMDIEMPNVNGLEASYKLREFDFDVKLVFLTNLQQYALKGYEVEALDYLIKPLKYSSLKNVLLKVLKTNLNNKKIVIKNVDGIFTFSMKDIYYLEALHHKIIYHTTNGDFSLWGNFALEEEKLDLNQFAYCNNCYLVNLNYVTKIDNENVYLNDICLKISRSKRKEFIAKISSYIQ